LFRFLESYKYLNETASHCVIDMVSNFVISSEFKSAFYVSNNASYVQSDSSQRKTYIGTV